MSTEVKKKKKCVRDFWGFLSKVLLTVALQLPFCYCCAALPFAPSISVLVSLSCVPHCSFPFVYFGLLTV